MGSESYESCSQTASEGEVRVGSEDSYFLLNDKEQPLEAFQKREKKLTSCENRPPNVRTEHSTREENMELVQLLQQTLNPVGEARKNAERRLLELEKEPEFALKLLMLMEQDGTPVNQQLAAVYFKNMVKKYWAEENGVISTSEKEKIKTHLLTLMCKVASTARPSLSEAIKLIGDIDFPDKWSNLLPDLTSKLRSTQDLPTIIGLLETANTLFKFFRTAITSDKSLSKLKHCLDNFQQPHLLLFNSLNELIPKLESQPDQLKLLFAAIRLLCRIFYSLNCLDLPEFYEDSMQAWMTEFHKLLSYENAALNPDDDDQPGPIELVKSAVIANLTLYATKYEEEFGPFLQPFVELSWQILVKTTDEERFDDLVVTAIKFLGHLVANPRLSDLFRPTLGEIVQRIVVPNLKLREHDQETFEDNPMEYIRRDIEGSDSETRRRSACDLVRNLCKHFEPETSGLCESAMGQFISQYSANRSNNWLQMDVSITLMIALAAKRYSYGGGVSEVNAHVNVDKFFNEFVLPVLTEANVSSQPIIKADVIKFFSTFRNQMPREMVVTVLPHLTRVLQADSYVVHTYAASAIERIFMMKQRPEEAGMNKPGFIYGADLLTPILEPAMVNLFAILEQREGGLDNEYVAKAIMRVLSRALPEQVTGAAPAVLGKLQTILTRVAEKPQNPLFIHYLFESLAVLVRTSCRANPSLVEQFEQQLMPSFNYVLQQDVTELTAYVFQMLAMLLELRQTAISPVYLNLFPLLLRPAAWENRGNIPALVRLEEAFLRKAAAETIGSNPQQLEGLLGVFQKLLSIGSTADLSFRLLVGIVEFLPPSAYSNYLGQIFMLILSRLQTIGPKIGQSFIFFLAVLIGKHGAEPVENALNSINPGVFSQIITDVWIPSAKKINTTTDRKACLVGMSRVLAESAALQSDPAKQKVWTTLFEVVFEMFENPSENVEAQSPEDALSALEEGGYSSSFAKLVYAQTEVRDSFSEIKDSKEYFVRSIVSASQKNMGKLQSLITSSPRANTFAQYCTAFNISI